MKQRMGTKIDMGMAAAAGAAGKRANVVKFQEALEQELEKGLFSDAVDAVKEALEAGRTVRSRTPEGITYVTVPDYAVRLAAAVTIMQYALGKPVNRTEMVVKGDGESSAQQRAARAAETLLEDPDTLIDVLDDWKKAAEGAAGRQRKAQPIALADLSPLPPA